MNAHTPTAASFNLTTGAYIMREADFDDGCFVRTVNGRRYGTGENKLGITVTLVLNEWLCGGCDRPLGFGVCFACETVDPAAAPIVPHHHLHRVVMRGAKEAY